MYSKPNQICTISTLFFYYPNQIRYVLFQLYFFIIQTKSDMYYFNFIFLLSKPNQICTISTLFFYYQKNNCTLYSKISKIRICTILNISLYNKEKLYSLLLSIKTKLEYVLFEIYLYFIDL